MKIEDITTETLMKASTPELRSLRLRCIQIYRKRFDDNAVQRTEFVKHGEVVSTLERTAFLNNYGLLKQAMKARGISAEWNHAIDKAFFRRAVRGLDVPSIGDIVIGKTYVAAVGDFIKAPREASSLELAMTNKDGVRDEELETKIATVLKAATGKEICFTYIGKSPLEPHIPIYDLVLCARKETRQISKIDDQGGVAILKGAISFKSYGIAPEATKWDAGREKRQMEVSDLKKYSAWFDSDEPDSKGSYKLPHHRASDGKAVWRAVSAAMAALFGARGGVDIPASDRKAVYNHLAKHYDEFEKEAPTFKFDIAKPSETNHVCVVGGGKYIRYRSQKRKSNGKAYTVRLGIKSDGKSEDYEYFYPKSEWTEAQARKHCKGHDGKRFEAAIAKIELLKTDEEDKFIKVLLYDVAESRIEETKRDLAGTLWGSIELPGDAAAVYVKTYGSDYYSLQRLEFPKDRWTADKVREWLDKYGLDMKDVISPAERKIYPALKFDIIKIDKKQHIIGGIVYEPNSEDTQGDYTTAPEIQKAMYGFMERYAANTNRIKVMHRGEAFQFPILESFQPEQDVKKGGHTVKAGAWWLMVKVTEPSIWAQIESGELTGFSMGGTATA